MVDDKDHAPLPQERGGQKSVIKKLKGSDLQQPAVPENPHFGKLTVTYAKDKTYVVGSLCKPHHIITVTAAQSADHQNLIKRCVKLAMDGNIKEDIRQFVRAELASR